MLKQYSKKSLIFGGIGIIGELAMGLLSARLNPAMTSPSTIILIIYVVFALMILVGLYYHLKAKGRSPLWLIVIVFNLIGLIILLSLKDKSTTTDK
jgi:hypothetical protein